MNRKVKTAIAIADEKSTQDKWDFQKAIRTCECGFGHSKEMVRRETVVPHKLILTAQNYLTSILNELRHQATKDTMEDKVNVDRNDFNKPNKKWKSNQDTFTYHYGVANQKMGEEIVNENTKSQHDNVMVVIPKGSPTIIYNKYWKEEQLDSPYISVPTTKTINIGMIDRAREDNIMVKNGKMTFKGTGINAFALLGLHNAGVI